ncbi:AAA family ATPase [Rothia endophytica]|uniref:AAA family ATPase n=1 Tax=Rothia endophytica TaxID=1324766 RepID=UPI001F2DED98|nr:AAA family ATPase [Rothia endophytica]
MAISSLPLRSITSGDPVPPEERSRWPFTVPSVQALLGGLDLAPFTIIVGENGAGKSVIIEAIAQAYGLPAEGGTSWDQRESVEQDSNLASYLQLIKGAAKSRDGLFFRAETVHSLVAHRVRLESSIAHRYLHQSHGESALAMIEAAASRGGLWIFDEPESGLSFAGQLKLLALLQDHVDAGHQVLLCTHSPVLMAAPGAKILEIGEWGLRPTALDDLEALNHWRAYLDSPQRYLRHLLSADH